MASGRMIQRKISSNKEIPKLMAALESRLGHPHGAMAALLYSWCIAHLDVAGRMHGDPVLVKGAVVPRISFITEDLIRQYLLAMNEIGLVVYYEAEDDLWLEFPAFEKSQPNLRKDREAPSAIPDPASGRRLGGPVPQTPRSDAGPAQESFRSDAGQGPAEEKRREEKRRERSLPRARVIEPEPIIWGGGPFGSIWEEIIGVTAAGDSLRLERLAERCERATRLAAVSGSAAATSPENYARLLVNGFKAVVQGWRDAKRPTPAMSVKGFEDNFERAEEWAHGVRLEVAVEHPGRIESARHVDSPSKVRSAEDVLEEKRKRAEEQERLLGEQFAKEALSK